MSKTVRMFCENHNCFMHKEGNQCDLLREKLSKGHSCPFYQTQEEVDEGRAIAHNRLLELGRYDLIKKYEYNEGRKGMW